MTDLLPQTILHNHLFYGDNLEILRKHIPDNSVDLVYLDPPFNSDVNYNVLFGTKSKATENDAQVQAFTDTWHWNQQAETAFDDVMTSGNTDAAELLRAIRGFLKESDMMAYLAMMAVRLLELHRVLKDGGSLYLHCDATACAYLKILLDGVFGPANFRNNIVWKRIDTVKGNHGQGSKFFGPNTDDILFYTKGENYHFEHVFSDYTEKYKKVFKYEEPDGRKYRLISMIGPGGAAKGNPYYECLGVSRYWRYSKAKMSELVKGGLVVQLKPGQVPQKKLYLDQGKGVASQSLWDGLKAAAKEKLGYPTQKPVALLERIIATSSKPGDVILDPFCGCGTTIHAAQKLGRTWVGIDVTHLAISLIDKRLKDAFPGIKFSVHGTPRDLSGAKALAAADKYQFQWWAVSLVNAVPWGGKKKGADSGIDGVIYFKPDGKTTEKAIVSVKGGENVNVAMVRDLAHVVTRENAKIGIFITLATPSKPMLIEAVKEGFYEPPQHAKVPKIQILTIENLLKGGKPSVPMVDPDAFKKASKEVATHPTLF